MPIEKRTRPYEVLIRLRHNEVEVAHVAEIEEIVEGDVVLAAKEGTPRPLALAGPEFGAIVEHINRAVLAHRDVLAVEVADLKLQREAAAERAKAQDAEIDRLRKEVDLHQSRGLAPGSMLFTDQSR